jgi:hypothetical protein
MPLENLDDYVAVGDENLGVAIDLFVEGKSYIGALILAVAAHDLFDRAIKKAAKKAAKKASEGAGEEVGPTGILDWEFATRQYIDPAAPAMSYCDFKRFEQRERHAAVHGPERQNKLRPMRSAKEAAELAIMRAQTNARVLERPRTAADEKFHSWMMWEAGEDGDRAGL